MSAMVTRGKRDLQGETAPAHETPTVSGLPVPDLRAAKVAENTLSTPSERSPVRNAHPPRQNVVYDPELHQVSKDAKKLEWKLSLEGMIQAFQEVFKSCGPHPSLADCIKALDAPVRT